MNNIVDVDVFFRLLSNLSILIQYVTLCLQLYEAYSITINIQKQMAH